jgi:hypothetical protein
LIEERGLAMKKGLALLAAVPAVCTLAAVTASTRAATPTVTTVRTLSFEFVGQFVNSPPAVTPATHEHYGYVSYASGLKAFDGAAEDETTALYTFYASARTLRVISDGPVRVITRVGTLTIYRDPSSNGSFGNPGTFSDGAPVLVTRFRQQSVLDTVSSTFTTFHENKITSARPFTVGTRRLQLGVVGGTFTTQFAGRSNMPGPPSGYFGGFARSR